MKGSCHMKIKNIPVEKINPAPYNPREELKPGDSEYEKLVRSIKEFGYIDPLIWNERTGNLVGGHQRFNVLLAEGYTELEVSVVDFSEEKEKFANLALNKVSGKWDEEKLADLLAELEGSELNLESGFDQKEIESLIKQFTEQDDEMTEFFNQELSLETFEEDNFECKCPKCGFVFDPKENNQ